MSQRKPLIDPRQVGAPDLYALVQIMRVSWNKSERGGAGSRQRAAVPEALPISNRHLQNCANEFVIEELDWSAAAHFLRPSKELRRRIPLTGNMMLGCVSIAGGTDRLTATYQWSAEHGGAPERAFPWQRELIIEPDEWVRFQYNGRFTSLYSGEWWYQQMTLNVALLSGAPSGKIFVNSKPTREFRSMVHLH